MSKSNNPTAAQKRRFAALAEMGCIVCEAPANIHHCFTVKGCRKDHDKTIPLCDRHHNPNGEWGVALHAGKRAWEAIYGTEEVLLDKVNLRLNYGKKT